MLEERVNIVYEQVSVEEWDKMQALITFNAKTPDDHKRENYVKVPFKEAISLVGRRAAFLFKGMVYVPLKELYSIASAHFRNMLSYELIKAAKSMN
jgi:DNA primase large subunit